MKAMCSYDKKIKSAYLIFFCEKEIFNTKFL